MVQGNVTVSNVVDTCVPSTVACATLIRLLFMGRLVLGMMVKSDLARFLEEGPSSKWRLMPFLLATVGGSRTMLRPLNLYGLVIYTAHLYSGGLTRDPFSKPWPTHHPLHVASM